MIRVLCVEDSALVRDYLQARLAQEPDMLVIEGADSTDVALVRLLWEPADVILLDYHLRGTTGMQLLQTLSDWQPGGGPGRKVPAVLFCCGLVDDRLLGEARDWGAQGVLRKERAPADLVRAVRCVAAGGSWFDREAWTDGRSDKAACLPN